MRLISYRIIKKISDMLLSIILIILFVPFWIVIPLIIKIDSPGNVLFKQKRVGINSEYFYIFKFRTMKEETPDIPTDEFNNQDHLYTRSGKILRRWSIDEFPQLINILRGEMSFVGPRPALYNQDFLIKLRKERGVDRVKPGVTGLAQINGRDDLSIPDKVTYDHLYVKDASLWLDMKIFLITVKAAVTGKGAR
ncbi:MAG: sugar transferase [Actinomycetota bacterium]|nr:sugar transferase [Actinomycetota bacterium]